MFWWLAGCASASGQSADVFARFLDTPAPVADGFVAPDGAPCGEGCWTWRRPSPVRAVANGRVESVGSDELVTAHSGYEDEVQRTWRIRWTGVKPSVIAGAEVRRGDILGTAQTLRAEGAEGPVDQFLAEHPRLPVPQTEPVLALVSHEARQMRIYRDGAPIATYEVGFGQAEGAKERRGDNRTPKGVYHVVARSKGPFAGDYAAYYGGYWIKLGYPNAWDAARGVDEGLFDAELQRTITRAFWARETPPQGTKLGGGIGFHGWAYEWDDAGPRGLSWGCVVLHLRDVAAVYEALPEGAMVVLF